MVLMDTSGTQEPYMDSVSSTSMSLKAAWGEEPHSKGCTMLCAVRMSPRSFQAALNVLLFEQALSAQDSACCRSRAADPGRGMIN